MSAVVIASGETPVSLNEARDWLRLGPGDNDAAVSALIRAAANLCEAFTGRMLIVREVVEEQIVIAAPLRLSKQPVGAVLDVVLLDSPGAPHILAASAWTVRRGSGEVAELVWLTPPPPGQRVRVRYAAGLAVSPSDVPEALRQGILRLVQHWHFSGADDARLPTIVTALWTPWRRLSLGAAA
jgi:uncharacterized phiE125 gp8 family phage protein